MVAAPPCSVRSKGRPLWVNHAATITHLFTIVCQALLGNCTFILFWFANTHSIFSSPMLSYKLVPQPRIQPADRFLWAKFPFFPIQPFPLNHVFRFYFCLNFWVIEYNQCERDEVTTVPSSLGRVLCDDCRAINALTTTKPVENPKIT